MRVLKQDVQNIDPCKNIDSFFEGTERDSNDIFDDESVIAIDKVFIFNLPQVSAETKSAFIEFCREKVHAQDLDGAIKSKYLKRIDDVVKNNPRNSFSIALWLACGKPVEIDPNDVVVKACLQKAKELLANL